MKFIYSVFDSAAGYFSDPLILVSKGDALRGFINAVNTPKHPYNETPSDYSLFLFGEFDELTGTFILEASPVRVALAVQYVRPVVNTDSPATVS